LVTFQAEELLNFKGKGVPGWISSCWHRSVDSSKAIMLTAIVRIEFRKSWLEKTDFSEHLNMIKHLIEGAESGYYRLVKNIENL
jgi:hypothetical protein